MFPIVSDYVPTGEGRPKAYLATFMALTKGKGQVADKGNKKSFYRYMNSKKRVKEKPHSLSDMGGNIVTKDEEKAQVFNIIFTSVFNSNTCCPEDNWLLELVDSDKKLNSPSVIQEETVSNLLIHLDPHKSRGQMEST
ncbi:hypothetical protein WISP_102299 [Willisornis vidua]|uniref:Uncharacterized protein n=1 Tax=Willisornis vidua TaxID=1566151 RepID=A0ABQ9D429_9PASS|nr:hypothetical protein WISP_102299 [Willisornis vidua]